MSTEQIFANALWKHRFPLLLICIAVTGVAAPQLANLRVSNSMDMWYPQDDPVLLRYQQFQQQFGSDEIVVIAITSNTGFDAAEGLEQVADLTDALYVVAGVANVTSISTVPAALLQARARLLSDDGKMTALLVQMSGGQDLEQRRHAILADLATAVDETGLDAKFAGYGVIYDSLNQASTEDSTLLVVAAHVVMLLLLIAFFRRTGPAVVTVLAVGMATTWTMGLYAALGQQINMVTMALPTLVLVIGVADCVHLLRAVARQGHQQSREVRITRGIAEVIGPCMLTSVTTALGFLALTLSDLPVVQTLGWFGAIGMLAAFATSLLVVSAALTSPYAEVPGQGECLDQFASRAARLAQQSPGVMITVFVVLAVIAAGGLLRLQTDTYSIGYLSDEHIARQDSDTIEAMLGPYAPVDYIVRADNVLQGDVLDSLQAWQRAATQIDGVGWSWSLLDALDIDAAVKPSAVPANVVAGQLARMRLLSPAVADSMISGQTELRVSFGAPMMSARSLQQLMQAIESSADLPIEVTLQATGYANLYTRIVERIVSSQVNGFTLALALILLAIFFATRSVARVLLALPANLFPLAATLGLMGWSGIPLDVATVTIATVILGLVVDDTVHILRPGPQGASDLATSTRCAVSRSGGSLIMTSLVLGGGFLVMGLAEIRTVAWFGLLSSFAMFSAIAADLLLLPALTAVGRRVKTPELTAEHA